MRLPLIIISIALVIGLLLAGIYLHRTGKPYSNLVFSIHKLFTIAVIILMSLVLDNTLWPSMGSVEWVILGTLILSLLGRFVFYSPDLPPFGKYFTMRYLSGV